MTAKQTTKRIYGDRGNSFVAVVEFGPRCAPRASWPAARAATRLAAHFSDQAEMYSRGEFKDVLF
jgi:acyl-homoserine-lactone acylase